MFCVFITLSCPVPAPSGRNVYITDCVFLQESKRVRAGETVRLYYQNTLRWLFLGPNIGVYMNRRGRAGVLLSFLISYPLRHLCKCRHQCCATCKKSFPSPNVAHDTPYRLPPIQHRWQVAKLNWHQNFPKYIISPQARRDEPTLLFTCSFCAF